MGRVRAAVLAAGRGIRMGGDVPKTLLPVGANEPLLFYILNGLRRAGVEDLLIVTGFKPEMIQSYASEHWGGEVTYVRNARYASWGNFHSVRVALDGSPGMDVLVVNSDVIVSPDVYKRVATARGDLVVAVEKRLVVDDEDMKVRLEGDKVISVSKGLKRSLAHGEYDGVSLLRPVAADIYSTLCNAAEWAGDTGIYYEDVYDRMTGLCDVRALFVEPGDYAEIDTPEDVAGASQIIDANRDAWAPQPA